MNGKGHWTCVSVYGTEEILIMHHHYYHNDDDYRTQILPICFMFRRKLRGLLSFIIIKLLMYEQTIHINRMRTDNKHYHINAFVTKLIFY